MNKEKAIIVGVELPKDKENFQSSMTELENLADTAGAEVVGKITQRLEKPNLKYFIGEGKLIELKNKADDMGVDLIIFDNDIHASQQRNLEEFLGKKIINRTELILDIFAQHAHSHEGRLQVELAQNQFMLTRLTGKGITLSRLGGGIGTRGPGETKLEQDRRKIRARISRLKKELEKISKSRSVRKNFRIKSGIIMIIIVGVLRLYGILKA